MSKKVRLGISNSNFLANLLPARRRVKNFRVNTFTTRLNYTILLLSLEAALVPPKLIVTCINEKTYPVHAHKFISHFSCLEMNSADPFASDPEDMVVDSVQKQLG